MTMVKTHTETHRKALSGSLRFEVAQKFAEARRKGFLGMSAPESRSSTPVRGAPMLQVPKNRFRNERRIS